MFRHRGIMAVVLLALCGFIGLPPARGEGEDLDSLRLRLKQLEDENRQLRETTELQTQELLELRAKVKKLESAVPEPDDESRIVLGPRVWNYTAGIILFEVFDSGDALSRGSGAFTTGGSMVGYEFSGGKDKDRFGITVYQGTYESDGSYSPSPKTTRYSRRGSDRIDLDVAWSRLVVQTEQFAFGCLLGGKYLRSDKTIAYQEATPERIGETVFDGVNEWTMLSGGLFLSGRVFRDFPLSAFIAGSVSLGVVHGMAADMPETAPDDGVIDATYRADTHPAWGFNGSLGLMIPVTRHGMLRLGYRGQMLNSTDGASPFINTSTFYDGHQSVFAAVSVLF